MIYSPLFQIDWRQSLSQKMPAESLACNIWRHTGYALRQKKSSLKKISGSTHTHTYTPHDVQYLSCTHSLNYFSVCIHILAVRLFFIICFRVLLRITHSFPSLSLYDFFLLYRSLLSFALTLTPSHKHCSLPFVFFWFFFLLVALQLLCSFHSCPAPLRFVPPLPRHSALVQPHLPVSAQTVNGFL